MKRLQIPLKFVYEKFCVHEKILGTRNCRRKFIKTCKANNRDSNCDSINQTSKKFSHTLN